MSRSSRVSRLPLAQRLTSVAMALALGACATQPIPKWTAPARTQGAETNTHTLAFGYLYANAARDSYRNALVGQLGEQTLLANSLVVTGALAAALALGGAHRDAIAGAAVIGGTGYALGNLGLSRPRLLVYLAGEEAVNCAKRAVSPFDMPVGDLTELTKALLELARQRLVTEDARREVDAALQPFLQAQQLTVNIVMAAQAALLRSSEVQRLAGDAFGAGRAFEAATLRAEGELIFAVDRIDAAVVRATLDTVPDLSAVPAIIGGLAGSFEQIAPGAGVGARTSAGLAALAGNEKSMSGKAGDPAPKQIPEKDRRLIAATQQLEQATAALSERSIDVSARLTGRAANWNADAFKECGVSDLATALRVVPELLQFSLGAEPAPRSIIISGGNKPYVLEFEGPVPAGITLRQPLPGERRAEITVGKEVKTPQALTLRVMDSSSTMRMQSVTVSVAAPAAPALPDKTVLKPKVPVAVAGVAGAGASAPVPGTNAAAAVAQALRQHGPKPVAGLLEGMVMSTPPELGANGRVSVLLSCPAGLKDADKPTVAAVAQALLALAGAGAGAVPIDAMAKDAAGVSCLR